MAYTVIGMFEKEMNAERAVENLLSSGIKNEYIDISSRNISEKQRSATGQTAAAQEDYSYRTERFFNSLFGNQKEEIKTHTEAAQRGTVVTVHTQSKTEAEKAARIMDENGAIGANELARLKGTTGTTETTGTTTTKDTLRNEPTSIPVIEEQLEVGKRVVESGSVRLKSRIIEKPVEERIRLRSERISIERTPVNRPATEEDMKNFKPETIEGTEKKEIPVIKKEAKVVEEVKLKKEIEEKDETIRESLKRKDVEAERLKEKDKDKNKNRDI